MQGAREDGLQALIEADISLLANFLHSPLGKSIFTKEEKAFPELPFTWKLGDFYLHGTMDRFIEKKDKYLVVDYKSSILDESVDRYRFQVSSYMAAVKEWLEKRGDSRSVEGYLVNLFSAQAIKVSSTGREKEILLDELQRIKENYTLADEDCDPIKRGMVAGEKCFSCAYSLHCELGKDFVLGSN
jgi:CRISPR/Cas system-associated exonuclease Cas4 (RecB family)